METYMKPHIHIENAFFLDVYILKEFWLSLKKHQNNCECNVSTGFYLLSRVIIYSIVWDLAWWLD